MKNLSTFEYVKILRFTMLQKGLDEPQEIYQWLFTCLTLFLGNLLDYTEKENTI